VDLCISLISWSFHYPLETYFDDVLECLSDDGSLLLDFRRGTGQLDKARNYFEGFEIISSTEKYRRAILNNPLKSCLSFTDSPQELQHISS
jgi:hypothetical protein